MSIASKIHEIQEQIKTLETVCHRPASSVHLLAVTKNRTALEIIEAVQAGLTHFGESYYQEAIDKINTLSNYPLCWHFIGPIQKNKAKAIAQHFSWVHSLSRREIADILNEARPLHLPPLNVCIQVNIDNETTKSGITPEEISLLASHILSLPALKLRGLMVIPKPEADPEKRYNKFLKVAQLLEQLNQKFTLSLDTLSMGMSEDFKEAIQAGSTWIRIGKKIFNGA